MLAAFGAVWVVWGSTYLAIAWAVDTIPPLLMIGARSLLAGAVLYGWSRVRGGQRPEAGDWRAAIAAGILLFVTGQAVLAWAETRIDTGPAALLIATEPLFIALLAWRGGRLVGLRRRGPRPSARTWGAMSVGFLGVALLVLPGGGTRLDATGAGAVLFASLSWSIGLLRSGARPGISPPQLAGMQLLAAGVVLVAVSLVTGEAGRLVVAEVTPRSLAAFGYLVVFGSIVTYAAYVWLLERVGPQRLSTHAYVNPAVAVALGAVFADESVGATLLLSMVLILGSVIVLVRGEPAPARPDPAGAPPVTALGADEPQLLGAAGASTIQHPNDEWR